MKILIIDNEIVTANLLKSRLEPLGHTVEITAKNENMDGVVADGWDVIFYDPSPLTTLRPTVMGIRRANRKQAFMILMSHNFGFIDAIKAGFNDCLSKPLDMNAMLDKIDNAKSIMAIQRNLGDDKEDFPSAGGVIAKSAFNQLFLSCMDRADRYGETAHVIFIAIDNFKQIESEGSAYDAKIVSAKLAHHLVQLRRQSDIIAQVKDNEYALLLLRPTTEAEPMEAAHRFAESLSKCTDMPYNSEKSVNIRLTLVRLPTGEMGAEHRIAVYQA